MTNPPDNCTYLDKETGENKTQEEETVHYTRSMFIYILGPTSRVPRQKAGNGNPRLAFRASNLNQLAAFPSRAVDQVWNLPALLSFSADLLLLPFLLVLIDEFLGRCCSIKIGSSVTSKDLRLKGRLKCCRLLLFREAIFPRGKKGRHGS